MRNGKLIEGLTICDLPVLPGGSADESIGILAIGLRNSGDQPTHSIDVRLYFSELIVAYAPPFQGQLLAGWQVIQHDKNDQFPTEIYYGGSINILRGVTWPLPEAHLLIIPGQKSVMKVKMAISCDDAPKPKEVNFMIQGIKRTKQ
jgi:hypothetical protein